HILHHFYYGILSLVLLSYHTIGKKGYNCTDCTVSTFVPFSNHFSRYAVSLDHYLLLYDIRQVFGGVLYRDQVWLSRAVPYHIEPVAFDVASGLYKFVRSEFDKLAAVGACF